MFHNIISPLSGNILGLAFYKLNKFCGISLHFFISLLIKLLC